MGVSVIRTGKHTNTRCIQQGKLQMTETSNRLSRRAALTLGGVAVATAPFAVGTPARAADKVLRIPINMPFTGEEAEGALEVKNGAELAIDEINAKGGVAGYKFELVLMDDGTANAG